MTRFAPAHPVLPLPPARRPDRLDFTPGACHLWLVPVRARPDWLALLSRDERRRADRLAGTPAAAVFVTSRAAQRLVGSRYLGVAPSEVTIDRDCGHCGVQGVRHGRPVFHAASFDYSVSHTQRWLVLAVTGNGVVGVDIESLDAAPDADGLARATLNARERHRFECVPAGERTAWLLSAWTRKEAAMKLAGLGLRAPPDRIDVRGPRVSAPAVPRWPAGQIHLYGLGAPQGHVAALATTVPLVSLHRFELAEIARRQEPVRAGGRMP